MYIKKAKRAPTWDYFPNSNAGHKLN